MKKIEICEMNALMDGEKRPVSVSGFPPLVVYKVEGEFFVTSNVCTHGFALLSDGHLDGCVIECPLHGGAFDIKTGDPVEFPCEDAIKTYPVSVQAGKVCIVAE